MTKGHSQKGLKGFQKIPKSQQKTERYSYKMTKAESDALNNYCETNEITKASVFKTALMDFYDKNNIVIESDETVNPNQLKMSYNIKGSIDKTVK